MALQLLSKPMEKHVYMSTLLGEQIDTLAAFSSSELPVISLYLNTQADQHGRDNYAPFLRKELRSRAKTFVPRSPARVSFERDVDRIEKYLAGELRPSTNGVAIFACAGENEFFETMQVNAPLERHEIYVDKQPHLYTLARINDQYPRYAAIVADTNSARLFVFGLNATIGANRVEGTKVSRTQVGGWAQARYQRHVENYHLHHAKEVLDLLDRIVREERIQHIVFAGDEVVIPLLQKQLSPALAEKVVDVLRLEINTPEHRILEATLAVMRRQDAKDDAERVAHLIGDYRCGGLAVVGAHDVMEALGRGQVEEVLLSSAVEQEAESPSATGDAIVTQARQTGAKVSFIEDASLLAEVGGIGASLRYRI